MQEPKITAATLARTAVLALALTNQLLSAAGKPVLPIESAALEQAVTAGLTVAASLWSWWKNNAFTPRGPPGRSLSDPAARPADALTEKAAESKRPLRLFFFLGIGGQTKTALPKQSRERSDRKISAWRTGEHDERPSDRTEIL